jgi:hypothetical protein
MDPKMFRVSLTPEIKKYGESHTLRGELAGLRVFDTKQPEHLMFLTASEAADWSARGWSVKDAEAKPEPKPKAAKPVEEK